MCSLYDLVAAQVDQSTLLLRKLPKTIRADINLKRFNRLKPLPDLSEELLGSYFDAQLHYVTFRGSRLTIQTYGEYFLNSRSLFKFNDGFRMGLAYDMKLFIRGRVLKFCYLEEFDDGETIYVETAPSKSRLRRLDALLDAKVRSHLKINNSRVDVEELRFPNRENMRGRPHQWRQIQSSFSHDRFDLLEHNVYEHEEFAREMFRDQAWVFAENDT